MKELMMIALMAVGAGAAQAEESALGVLKGAVNAEAAVPCMQEPAAVPAGKGFFQNWGNGGQGNGFFKPWDKSAKAVWDTKVYRNAEGCEATVEERRNGSAVYVRDARGEQAFLWVANDLNSGDISSFCSPAAVSAGKSSVRLSCGEQDNGGDHTRGEAVLNLAGGLSSVSVRGEVKKALGWRTDTELSCSGLRPAGDRGAAVKGVFLGVEACSVLDGVYPSGMTGAEAQEMLGGCFSGISAKYGLPVTFAAETGEMAVLVGCAPNSPTCGNGLAARDIRKALAGRGNRIFDYNVTVLAAK